MSTVVAGLAAYNCMLTKRHSLGFLSCALQIGSDVMLNQNIDIKLGLVNGALGKVRLSAGST